MARAKTPQTALCIIPPEDLWPPIQEIRSQHDKAYPRWMPHINLVYPFVPEKDFPSIKSRLESVVHQHRPFCIQFDASSFHYFEQKGKVCTYHLRPAECREGVALQKSIETQLPSALRSSRPFEAHLTLGQCTTSEMPNRLRDLTTNWKPVDFLVDRIFLISRENHPEDRFVIKEEIPLLGLTDSTSTRQARCSLNVWAPKNFSSRLTNLFDGLFFVPRDPCRIILAEYDDCLVDPTLRRDLESLMHFDLTFGPDSLLFDPPTSRLSLRPTNSDLLDAVKPNSDAERTMLIGDLDPKHFDEAHQRFSQFCQTNSLDFGVDRLYLCDENQATKFVFQLKMK